MIERWRDTALGKHARFEQWCALAPLGGLDAQEMNELERHSRSCSECRQALEKAAQTSLEIMPFFWPEDKRATNVPVPEGMRARFSRRLHEDEHVEHVEPLNLPPDLGEERTEGYPGPIPEESGVRRPWHISLVPSAVAISAVLTLFFGGYYFGLRAPRSAQPQAQAAASANPAESAANSSESDDRLQRQKALLTSALSDLEKERASAREAQGILKKQLADSNARIVALQQSASSQQETSLKATQAANQELQMIRKDDEAVQARLAQAEAFRSTLDHRIGELQAQLDAARSVAREEDSTHLPEGQLGEMLTARNLHIVDVYDSDGGGNRKRSFGRVFYVEGKSLLFYAYDLHPTRQAKASVVFHVWGSGGTKEVTHSLGLLRNENAEEGLWTLTFDDPAVLAQINSVFVTAEPADRRDEVPHGKKLLYAYFGNPANHP